MESHYEINVSLNGHHLFATAPRSLVERMKAVQVRAMLRERFPVSEGFKVDMTHWEGIGHTVE